MRIALIGATGLVGRTLGPRLAARHDLTTLGRRSSDIAGAHDLVRPVEQWDAGLPKVDIAISALGSTLRQAGSFAAFRAIDETAVLAFAHAARAAGARQFIFMSSVGAHPTAASQYLRLKAEVESQLGAIDFDRLDLVRPGLLRGHRGADRRLGESLAILASPLAGLFLRGSLDRFAAIDATTVAAAIAGLADEIEPGTFVHHNRELVRRAGAAA